MGVSVSDHHMQTVHWSNVMSACSERCSWCGRCSEAWEHENDPVAWAFCDECGADVRHPISIACLGLFCSPPCADRASEKHATVMDQVRRG